MLLLHTLFDRGPAGSESRETGFGVVRSDFTPKPSGCLLALAWAGLEACPPSLG
jgi:hypothetical protein